MKLKPLSLAIGSAIAFAIIWGLCSVFVFAAPGIADAAFSGMMHADMPAMHVTPIGFVTGLVGWALTAGVTAFVLAIAYNTMAGDRPAA